MIFFSTGLKFYVSAANSVELTVALQIYGRSIINFSEGLMGEETIALKNSDRNYIEHGSKTGVLSQEPNYMINSNNLLKFVKSDLTQDAGQNFVPYFDDNEIALEQPAPLSSIGLMHYTNHRDYAGFIRVVIKSFHYEEFINEF